MEKRLCIICNENKDIKYYIGKLQICSHCLNVQEEYKPKKRKVNSKEKLVKKILFLAEKSNIKVIDTYLVDVDFSEIREDELEKYTIRELNSIIERLEEIESGVESENNNEEVKPIIAEEVDTNKILLKYQDHIYRQNDEYYEGWRHNIPSFIKMKIKSWEFASMHEVYEIAKQNLSSYSGKKYDELLSYITDLSRIIFTEIKKESDGGTSISEEVEDYILHLVEMIIMPHIEVLDKINNNNGNIVFMNTWNQVFTEGLKTEVKNRDGWKCVVCEEDKGLHVHHKIPRRLGGSHHVDNLVTLCSSCHKAIETADISKAFNTCLKNYKNRLINNTKVQPIIDKISLQDDVQAMLNKIILELKDSGEENLLNELISLKEKLGIIFYE